MINVVLMKDAAPLNMPAREKTVAYSVESMMMVRKVL
jgi:hypothetical protein